LIFTKNPPAPPAIVGTDPLDQDTATKLKGAWWSIRQDYREGLRGVWTNSLAGSPLVPRALRYLMYRLSPHSIRSPLVRPRVYITGTELSIAQGTAIAYGCYFEALVPVTIGHSGHFGPFVVVLTSTHPVSRSGKIARRAELKPVTVGNHCFIGARAILTAGVTIGDGVVIAAGAVVVRDCLEPGVYAGSPARLVRRFDDDN
jgi:acetyltransferase-like isoleucine patch superfamily enzyme